MLSNNTDINKIEFIIIIKIKSVVIDFPFFSIECLTFSCSENIISPKLLIDEVISLKKTFESLLKLPLLALSKTKETTYWDFFQSEDYLNFSKAI